MLHFHRHLWYVYCIYIRLASIHIFRAIYGIRDTRSRSHKNVYTSEEGCSCEESRNYRSFFVRTNVCVLYDFVAKIIFTHTPHVIFRIVMLYTYMKKILRKTMLELYIMFIEEAARGYEILIHLHKYIN